jgi:hypothetical protein
MMDFFITTKIFNFSIFWFFIMKMFSFSRLILAYLDDNQVIHVVY